MKPHHIKLVHELTYRIIAARLSTKEALEVASSVFLNIIALNVSHPTLTPIQIAIKALECSDVTELDVPEKGAPS